MDLVLIGSTCMGVSWSSALVADKRLRFLRLPRESDNLLRNRMDPKILEFLDFLNACRVRGTSSLETPEILDACRV